MALVMVASNNSRSRQDTIPASRATKAPDSELPAPSVNHSQTDLAHSVSNSKTLFHPEATIPLQAHNKRKISCLNQPAQTIHSRHPFNGRQALNPDSSRRSTLSKSKVRPYRSIQSLTQSPTTKHHHSRPSLSSSSDQQNLKTRTWPASTFCSGPAKAKILSATWVICAFRLNTRRRARSSTRLVRVWAVSPRMRRVTRS